MDLRWSQDAADDLERITDFLFENVPERAAELIRTLYNAPAILLTFPHRAGSGKKEGTRELVLTALPYIVVYRVEGDMIEILRILHGAQKWP